MARPCPHPLALFSLYPYKGNVRAERIISHPDNSHTLSTLSNGKLALDIDFHLHRKSNKTLATLGRGDNVDIYVEGAYISQRQCSFELDSDTGVVMLYDRSSTRSIQVFGRTAEDELNTIVGMGGERRDLVQFELIWHQSPEGTVKTINHYSSMPCGQVENPRLARTVDYAPTEFPSRYETRTHTPGQLKMRYVIVGTRLGSGQFGTVYKAINVDSGKFMAVKIIERPTRDPTKEDRIRSFNHALKLEVEILSAISHPHIIDYIGSQGWSNPWAEIFMGLKEGSLESLIKIGTPISAVAESVLLQMLQALDYITCKGIVHRDMKPENILYILQPSGRYEFQLGDFGLCNRIVDTTTFADVWSLFVTILWVLNAENFRQKSDQFKHNVAVKEAVLWIVANVDLVGNFREMAILQPIERASAAQLLLKLFNGTGLSTPRNQVLALTSSLSPALTTQAS
ncbi:calcium/calmodulin-dependent protein kinase [Sclerotinia borealis F-4128]|uniref:mitogen-activated protein kinase n=1 Tax=Sclerotinia borealis (strain F-4128) TaxID=1432307 RepID=W9CIY2_SCLBF|nr:calcium/calmodulin-dependent protein kinase [Sclerotinia borealis F-4128]